MRTRPDNFQFAADSPRRCHIPVCWQWKAFWPALLVLAFVSRASARPPHPAVARIIVPERSATSYGTGTLIDVRDQYGLVVTNWHVVRDGTGPPEVAFPNGFRSQARPLKLDSHWDLAALVIWRPPIEPVRISVHPPRPGELLTICGYGQGDYREAVGRCTQYFAPRVDYPHELVELNAEARQGDSGGPIFNERGELAGVLFGAGRGTTMGSYGGRVHSFLASLAPNIGQPASPLAPPAQIAGIEATPGVAAAAAPREQQSVALLPTQPLLATPSAGTLSRLVPVAPPEPAGHVVQRDFQEEVFEAATAEDLRFRNDPIEELPPSIASTAPETPPLTALDSTIRPAEKLSWGDIAGRSLLQQSVTLLAIIGAIALVMQLARLAS